MRDSPFTRIEIITILLTAVFLSPTFGNPLADMLAGGMVALMVMLFLLWMKYGDPGD